MTPLEAASKIVLPEHQSPTVVVCHCPKDIDIVNSLKRQGIQVTGFAPWRNKVDIDINTFRVGLFGLDKISNIDRTINDLEQGLKNINVISKF